MSTHSFILFFSVCVLAAIILTVISCNKTGFVDEPVQFTTPFTGITETDSTGPDPRGSIDTDDWKPLMDCSSSHGILIHISDTVVQSLPGCTFIRPAYPNPAKKYFTINFCVSDPDSVVLTLNSSPTTVLTELIRRRLDVGQYSVSVNGSDLPAAIYRVYITVYRRTDVLRSYGDVQIIH
jgi:hypothetical protein